MTRTTMAVVKMMRVSASAITASIFVLPHSSEAPKTIVGGRRICD